MAVAARRDDRMTVAEYRVWIEAKPDGGRWELLDGPPVLMSPTSGNHHRIAAKPVRRLDGLAEPKGCSALPGLAAPNEAMGDFAPMPDIVAHRGPPPRDGHTHDPLLVADVLSPTTMRMERGRKTDIFRTVPSLQTFPIVIKARRGSRPGAADPGASCGCSDVTPRSTRPDAAAHWTSRMSMPA